MDQPIASPSTSLPHPSFTLDMCKYQLSSAAFHTAATTRGLDHIRHRGFPSRAIEPQDLRRLGLTVEMSEIRHGNAHLLLSTPGDEIAMLQTYGGDAKGSPLHAAVMIAAPDQGSADALADTFVDAFGAPEPAAHLVPMTFWARSSQGPRPMHKLIDSPLWEDIAANYAPAARAQLQRLMATRNLGAGRLILWQGLPGTGKTYALRALARAWRDWCDFHVVVDPDIFFGEDSSYLMDILFLETGFTPFGTRRARLLVLEDTGELIAGDARAETGQALSRLLNVSDGLLGQGLELCTLITTNEAMHSLHPAVLRPGRCAAQIEVPALDVQTANDWLRDHGSDDAVTEPTTVAELFARMSDAQAELQAGVEQAVGRSPTSHAPTPGSASQRTRYGSLPEFATRRVKPRGFGGRASRTSTRRDRAGKRPRGIGAGLTSRIRSGRTSSGRPPRSARGTAPCRPWRRDR